MMSFNLLHYPVWASQRRKRHRWWTFLIGLLVGGALATALVMVVQKALQQEQRERVGLQSLVKVETTRLQADKARLALQEARQLEAARVQQLSAQQEAWKALHQALVQEMGPDSVQLMRLQLDGQTLELQGVALDVQRVAQVQTRLSRYLSERSLDSVWTLVSLVNVPSTEKMSAKGLSEFVWQASWPQAGMGPSAAVLANQPGPSE